MGKAYQEFRIQVTANSADELWSIDLRKCPIPGLIGFKGAVKPVITRQQLNQLRRRDVWATGNLGLLRAIGQATWLSIMTPRLEAAFESCLDKAQREQQRLHITFILQDEGKRPTDDAIIRLAELPIEALFTEKYGFIGTSSWTPISRSLQIEPDAKPIKMPNPLRILVVVASPQDMQGVTATNEIKALEGALAPLKAENRIVLEFCDPPTKQELSARLARRNEPCHILHFIGHGGFGTTAADPTPQGYVTLVREEDHSRGMPLYAHDFATFLNGSMVRLVVLTACSTATPASPDELEMAGAFADVAQRLISGPSSLAALVAMQFDLETDAAPEFTGTFYKHLLDASYSLDEVATEARKAIIAKKNEGHRAWVAPTVYHRCRNGILFINKREEPKPEKIHPPVSKPEIDNNVLRDLADLLERSGRVDDDNARRALCMEIGIEPGDLNFLTASAPHTFALQCVFHLYKTGDLPTLEQLCDAIAPILKGVYAEKLVTIQTKIEAR